MRECEQARASELTLDVISDPEPGALLRVLQQFANLNLLPTYFTAEACDDGTLSMRLEVTDCAPQVLERISAKLGQMPCIRESSWHYARSSST
jgi:hypothetical protein